MLTVSILNYNGSDTLQESIQSVLDQTKKPDRFVVIDNASIDDSRQIAVDMGVEVVDADNKYKFITGLNTAMGLNEDILFFMQNDVMLDKDCLKIMCQHHSWSKFFSQPLIYDTQGNIDNAGMDYKWPGYGERRKTKWWIDGIDNPDCGLVTTICFMTDCKYLWDTIFSPAYNEDLDMYLRTINEYDHVLIPAAKAIHKGNHTFSQTLNRKQISKICYENRIKLIKKHYQGFDRWLRLTANHVSLFLHN